MAKCKECGKPIGKDKTGNYVHTTTTNYGNVLKLSKQPHPDKTEPETK